MRKMNSTLLLPAVFLAATGSVFADEVTDTIDEAVKLYNEGAYSDSVESLNYASQLIQQKKGGSLAELLPEPMDGWAAGEVDSQAAGAAMFGGGVSAGRQYTKSDSTIDIKILTDSPMLQGMMMMFSNPMFASSDGGKLTRIKRQKAIVKYDKANRSGEITIVVANRFLITIEGNNAMSEDMKAYAEALDFKKITALP